MAGSGMWLFQKDNWTMRIGNFPSAERGIWKLGISTFDVPLFGAQHFPRSRGYWDIRRPDPHLTFSMCQSFVPPLAETSASVWPGSASNGVVRY